MNSTSTTTRTAAKHSGRGTRTAGILKGGARRMKVDWAFRRLRNQAVRFFAGGDPTLRRGLNRQLEKTHTYSQMQREITRELGPRKGTRTWQAFMDTFFAHKINRTRR